MSLVEIVEHDEVIYKILDKPPPEPPKTPRYQSKLEKQLKETKRPQQHRTFGYADVPLDPPENFLRKGRGIGQPVKKTDGEKCLLSETLPPLPKPLRKKADRPKVNFRVLNIKKAVKLKSKPIEPRIVDSRDGHTMKIKGSGEVPEYGLRADFGRTPSYLIKRNRRKQREVERMKYADEHQESLCEMISEEDRQKLLDDLKYKWQQLQKTFLQLPVLTDTIPKIHKKTKMEEELRELEKDIALVENNPYIYIFE